MVVKLAVEGKVKDKEVLDFIKEYQKRLSPYFKLELVELGEGGRYFEKISKQNTAEIFIAMDAGGKQVVKSTQVKGLRSGLKQNAAFQKI